MLTSAIIALTTDILLRSSPQVDVNLVSSPLMLSQSQLKVNRVNFSGTEGEYTASVAVTGDIDTIWTILTDYDNFANYMPNVIESQLISSEGNQKVFSQVQIFRLLFFSVKGNVTIEVTENYPQEITFRLIDGNLKSLNGSWTIQPMSSDEFLVTHRVSVEPKIESSDMRTMFFNIYEDTLKKTLDVVREETTKRSQQLDNE